MNRKELVESLVKRFRRVNKSYKVVFNYESGVSTHHNLNVITYKEMHKIA